MAFELESLGEDPLFASLGQIYKSKNGFYLNYQHGGVEARAWLDKNFSAREDDTYVVSFPKTGTTWAQEMVYVIGNDLDFKKAKATSLTARFPYLELLISIKNNAISSLTPPRFIKSHYPHSLLPTSIIDKKCKIVYTIRNPKDTLVSYYHFSKMNGIVSFKGDFEQFFNAFLEDTVAYAPYWKHILEFWERRHEDNILILFYEDMKKNPVGATKQVASFLGKQLTDEQAQQVSDHCSFDKMKANPMTNYKSVFTSIDKDFMRKGEVGDWKKHFTVEMNEKMDAYIDRHFKESGIKFSYD